jgi:putative Ca2+/H+ antiporter (TMEM165/GDT1 family)
MEAFLVPAGVVALAEIGDRTQLLAFVLAARYRRPLAIIAGILVATLANHTLAGLAGATVVRLLGPEVLRWVLALAFFAMAVWTLLPDKLGGEASAGQQRYGPFGTTLVMFFLAEMGDKTQIATVALAARYGSLAAVIAGTTCGMLLADVPAVLIGERLSHRLPIRLVHAVAALVFAAFGAVVLMGHAGGLLG